MTVHDRTSFENLYAGQPRLEIGRPQQALLDPFGKSTASIREPGKNFLDSSW